MILPFRFPQRLTKHYEHNINRNCCSPTRSGWHEGSNEGHKLRMFTAQGLLVKWTDKIADWQELVKDWEKK